MGSSGHQPYRSSDNASGKLIQYHPFGLFFAGRPSFRDAAANRGEIAGAALSAAVFENSGVRSCIESEDAGPVKRNCLPKRFP